MTLEGSQHATGSSPLESLRYATGTDVGKRREENQDSFGVILSPSHSLFIVADGMGGAKGGAIASRLAVETFGAEIDENSPPRPKDIIRAIRSANKQVHQNGLDDAALKGMGTTFVGLSFSEEGLLIFNVGDSRAYRFRGDSIEQLTSDHTLIGELLESGAISEEQAENHPVSHMLTRSLGPTDSVDPDCSLAESRPCSGDLYLLCSDGLYNLVQPDEMLRLIEAEDLESSVERLIELANERGGTDNITVVLISVEEDFLLERKTDSKPKDDKPSKEKEEASPNEDSTEEGGHEEDEPETEEDTVEMEIPEPSAQNGEAKDGPSPVISSSIDLSGVDFPPPEESIERHELSTEVRSAPAAAGDGWKRAFFVLLVVFSAAMVVVIPLLMNRLGPQPVETAGVQEPVASTVQDETVEPQAAPLTEETAELEPLPEQPEAAPEQSTKQEAAEEIEEAGSIEAGPLPTDFFGLDVQSQQALSERRGELLERVAALSGQLSGSVGEILNRGAGEIKTLNEERAEIREKIDKATRRLTVWFDRKKRVEKLGPLRLAPEVSVTSPQVKEQKERLDEVTYEYLQEVEALRYEPNDPTREQRVEQLQQGRRLQLRQLEISIIDAIEDELAGIDQEISQLTLERDRLSAEIEALQEESEFAEIALRGSQTQRNELISKYETELAQIELQLQDKNPPVSEPVDPPVEAGAVEEQPPLESAVEVE